MLQNKVQSITPNTCIPGCRWTKPSCATSCQIKFAVRPDKKNSMRIVKNSLRFKNKHMELSRNFKGIEKSPCIGCEKCDYDNEMAKQCEKLGEYVKYGTAEIKEEMKGEINMENKINNEEERIRIVTYEKCPKCGGNATKSGKINYKKTHKIVQRRTCRNCGVSFTEKNKQEKEQENNEVMT